MSDLAFWTALCPRTELGVWPQVEEPRVYVLVPPMLSHEGFSEFVIVARNEHGVMEIFPDDEDGRIEEWDPLAAFAGADHEQALRACGFEVVVFDAA